jgi:6-phosphogluconolactonase (cycloisomerase 2 family)
VRPIAGSTRRLGLDRHATPEFTTTPGQVAFTPDGRQLLVTTKANGNAVDVFRVRDGGRLGDRTVNELPGTVPFAAAFDPAGHVVLVEAGTNAVATFRLDRSGVLTPLDTLLTGQSATCWITGARGFFYASNAGSGTLTEVRAATDGTLASLGQAATDPGTVDATTTADGRYVYVQTGAAGVVDGYRVRADGTLAPVGSVTVPNAAGGEGITAS